MSNKASLSKLEKLHDALADYFTDSLESGEDLSSGTLAAINAFLKNNQIFADVVESESTERLSITLKELMTMEES